MRHCLSALTRSRHTGSRTALSGLAAVLALAVPMTNAADVRAIGAKGAADLLPQTELADVRELAAKSTMSDGLEPIAPVDASRINLARAFDQAPIAMSGFSFLGDLDDRERAVQCLAEAAYFEAGNDVAGQRAVMQVVLNRVRHPVYPATVCGVVFEGASRRTGCQFTFTCDGSRDRRWSDPGIARARKLAQTALDGYVDKSVGTATHYHADYVVPYWSASLSKIAVVGRHLFYTFPHRAGSRAYFRTGGGLDEPVIPGGIDKANETDPRLAVDLASGGATSAETMMDKVKAGAADGAIFQLVDLSMPSGRWAVSALDACADRPVCEVFAYTNEDALKSDRQRHPSERRPALTLRKDSNAGIEQVRWNCFIAPRAKPTECFSK